MAILTPIHSKSVNRLGPRALHIGDSRFCASRPLKRYLLGKLEILYNAYRPAQGSIRVALLLDPLSFEDKHR